MLIERQCRVTSVDNSAHLRASHCKPWRDSNNEERLDGENGLLLTPSIDHLFDRGFISFQREGGLIISPVAHRLSLERMGVRTDRAINVGAFTDRQDRFAPRIPSAIGRSNPAPSFLMLAGARLIVTLLFGYPNPEFISALLIRSRLSRTAVSGIPTVMKSRFWPGYMSTDIN